MGENDSINIEKGGESCQWTCRKGRKKNGEKKRAEKKRGPPVSTLPDSLLLSPYMAVPRVCMSVCVFVFVIRAQSQCCSERERLDQQTHADYNPSEGFFPNHSPKVLTPSPTLLHWILDWKKTQNFYIKIQLNSKIKRTFWKGQTRQKPTKWV